MKPLSGQQLEQHIENMRDTYKRLCMRADLHAVALVDTSIAPPTHAFFGQDEVRYFIELMNHAQDGEVWIVRRPSPHQPSQSVYLYRLGNLTLALFIETGHPVVKSIRRILTRSLKKLEKKKLRLTAQEATNTPVNTPPSWGNRFNAE